MKNKFPKSVCVLLLYVLCVYCMSYPMPQVVYLYVLFTTWQAHNKWLNRYSHQSLETLPILKPKERKQKRFITIHWTIFLMTSTTNVLFLTCRKTIRWKLIHFMRISSIILVVQYHLEAFGTKSASEVSLPNRRVSIYPAVSRSAGLSPCLTGTKYRY